MGDALFVVIVVAAGVGLAASIRGDDDRALFAALVGLACIQLAVAV